MDDQPGHTRSFTLPEVAPEHITTYRAGQPHPQVSGARLAWRELLVGIYRHPARTFAQMRAHQVWAPALIISAVYGLVAAFGSGNTRSQVLSSTFGTAFTIVLSSALGFAAAGVLLGTVTHALARRLGGDGAWAPTVGLSVIISWTSDAPRLLLTTFLSASNGVVQIVGWVTWLVGAWLVSGMVRQVHDLPWGKAAAAAALQLIALLVLIKLSVLG